MKISRLFPQQQHLLVADLIIALTLLSALYLPGIEKTPYHEDERHWIASSSYLETFARLRFRSPAWGESYWTLVEPPMARYIIGVGRLAGGFHADDLNGSWDYTQGEAANIPRITIPSARLLWWSRLPMTLLAIIAGIIFFLIQRLAVGRLGAYVFLMLFGFSPYLQSILRRAMGESALLYFVGLALLSGIFAASRWQEKRLANNQTNQWSDDYQAGIFIFLMSLFAGLAGATKLNGLGALFATILLASIMQFSSRKQPVLHRIRKAILRGFAVLVVGMGVFTIVNPFLYFQPYTHGRDMILRRINELNLQTGYFPDDRIIGFAAHMQNAVLRTFKTFQPISLQQFYWINFALAFIGMGYSFWLLTHYFNSHRKGPTHLVLWLGGIFLVIPALFTPLDWDRYYLFPYIFGIMFMGMGVTALVSLFRERNYAGSGKIDRI